MLLAAASCPQFPVTRLTYSVLRITHAPFTCYRRQVSTRVQPLGAGMRPVIERFEFQTWLSPSSLFRPSRAIAFKARLGPSQNETSTSSSSVILHIETNGSLLSRHSSDLAIAPISVCCFHLGSRGFDLVPSSLAGSCSASCSGPFCPSPGADLGCWIRRRSSKGFQRPGSISNKITRLAEVLFFPVACPRLLVASDKTN